MSYTNLNKKRNNKIKNCSYNFLFGKDCITSYSLVGIKYNFVHATLHLITYILNKVNNTNQTKKVMIHTRAANEAMTQSCSSSTQLMSQVHKMILLR